MELMDEKAWVTPSCVHSQSQQIGVHYPSLELCRVNGAIPNSSLSSHHDITRLQVVLLKSFCSARLEKFPRWNREVHINVLDAPKWHTFRTEFVFVQLRAKRATFYVISARTHLGERDSIPRLMAHFNIPFNSFIP